MIGTKIYKPLDNYVRYSKCAEWCNENNAVIEDKGDYYEVVVIPDPTAEELAEQELANAKAERAEAVSKITVEVDGMMFDGDETSQDRMSRTISVAMALGVDTSTEKRTWILADNTIAEVTVAQLAEALRLAGDAQTALWTIPYTKD